MCRNHVQLRQLLDVQDAHVAQLLKVNRTQVGNDLHTRLLESLLVIEELLIFVGPLVDVLLPRMVVHVVSDTGLALRDVDCVVVHPPVLFA